MRSVKCEAVDWLQIKNPPHFVRDFVVQFLVYPGIFSFQTIRKCARYR